MSETTTYYVISTTGRTGQRQTGYAIRSDAGDVVATFKIRDHGYWRFAKEAAERECYRMNRDCG